MFINMTTKSWTIPNTLPARLCIGVIAVLVITTRAHSAENAVAPAPGMYRMSQLDDAKKRAATEGKPIAWIASYPEYLKPYSNLMGNGSHAATAYAIRALQKETILVFSDGRTENHQEPRIVDQALHTPEPHYIVPGVVVLTPSLDKVICKAPFTEDAKERIALYTEVLKKIRDKDSWLEKPPPK